VIHYHGLPVTPLTALGELAGRCFCVSYAHPDQVARAHELGQSVMLDNGAFSFWRSKTPTDWDGYMDWAEPWLDYQSTWAVIPDVIDGDELANDRLIVRWINRSLPRGAPVWHMHESIDRLRRLCCAYVRVCIGSSGQYAVVGSGSWHRRMEQAFNAIAPDRAPNTWLHMLRGMSLSGGPYPFASVDSTDVARNHNRPQNTPAKMVARWDAMQCPARWSFREHLQLVPETDQEASDAA